MKKITFIAALTLLVFLGQAFALFAQAPEGFTYQAEARDASGKLLTTKSLTVETTILKGSSSGSVEWKKDYTVTTDNYGLFSLIIGELDGIPALTGDFSEIEWDNGTYFLNVKILWAKKWLDTGTTQLLSVPYALYAKSAENYTEEEKTKLTSIEAGAEVNVNADWNAIEGDARILNKPDLSGVASSGSYADLTGTPDLSVYATKNMANQNITNLANPANTQDAATKAYVDALKTSVVGMLKVNMAAGATVASLLQAGVRVSDLFDAGVGVGTLEQNGAPEQDLKDAGLIGTLADIDGNTYKWVKIGTQVWMAENLKTTKYNDNSAIPYGSGDETSGAYSWYDNDASYKNPYGALYPWFSANTGKLCPAGWHIPNNAEWTTLLSYLGGEDVAGAKLKEAGYEHWRENIYVPHPGTNESGFTSLPGGTRYSPDHSSGMKSIGAYWSYSESSSTEAWSFYQTFRNDMTTSYPTNKTEAISVRCIKD